jgi:hypothetical protein
MDSRQAERNALGDRIAVLLRNYRLAHTDDEGYGLGLTTLRSEFLQNLGVTFGDPEKGFCRA